ncbi:MAG TPA: tripartite tricarboxylate transporter substrate binding protein [Burkholderiales bacterium]|nr:tripartite tricarboxylate transporter substrate binding protein [Burkholderiales bacterium]
MKPVFLAALFSISMAFQTGQGIAQEVYPNRVVKIVVPFAAGGATDVFGRLLAERLTAVWKQSVIVDNRPGASGAIGSEAVAKSKPDGYTLLLGTATSHAVAPALYPNLPYDTLRDFVPVTELATTPLVLLVHPSLPVTSLKQFVEYARAHPGAISYSGSPGTGPYMSMQLLAIRAGRLSMQSIGYKGSGPAMFDLVAGNLNAAFNDVPAAVPYVREGKLRALAVGSAKRSPLLPEVPTVAESGYPGFDTDVWLGLFAPAGTPPEIVTKIAADVRTAFSEANARKKLEEGAFSAVASTPDEFATRVKDDLQKWRNLIKEANIKIE